MNARGHERKLPALPLYPPVPVGPPVTLSLGKVIPPSSVARSAAHWSQNLGSERKREVGHVGEQWTAVLQLGPGDPVAGGGASLLRHVSASGCIPSQQVCQHGICAKAGGSILG